MKRGKPLSRGKGLRPDPDKVRAWQRKTAENARLTSRQQPQKRPKPKSRGTGRKADPSAQIRLYSRASWDAYPLESCERRCGRRAAHRHHVIYEQMVTRWKGEPWDPDNAMGLCLRCHERQHAGGDGKIRITELRDVTIAFAFRTLGPHAYDYLRRRYDGPDPRIELALARAEPVEPSTPSPPFEDDGEFDVHPRPERD